MRASAQETQQKSTTTTDSRFEVRWDECSRQRFLAQHFALEIPPRFQGMTVTSWQTFTDKMEKVKSWDEDIETGAKRRKSLILVGKTGTGKTHLGTAIVMGTLRKAFVEKIVDCSLLLSEIYKTCGKDDAGRAKAEAAKLIRAYIDLDVLVIDKIGRGTISSHGVGPVHLALINHSELLTNALAR